MAHQTTTPTPGTTTMGHILRGRVTRKPPLPTATDPLGGLRLRYIESQLLLAVWHVKHRGTDGIQSATGHAIRAGSMLRHACTEAANAGRVEE